MISIVIPTHNAERQLVPTLAALVQGVTGGILRDVILTDGGSTDDTEAIADAAGCVFMPGVSDVGARLRQGAAQARGPWLLFLQPSSILEEGWAREVSNFLEMIERGRMGERVVGTFRLSVEGYGMAPRVCETVAAVRLALLGRPRPGQGVLISRRHYDQIGGHPAGIASERRLIARIARRDIHVLRAHVLLPVSSAGP